MVRINIKNSQASPRDIDKIIKYSKVAGIFDTCVIINHDIASDLIKKNMVDINVITSEQFNGFDGDLDEITLSFIESGIKLVIEDAENLRKDIRDTFEDYGLVFSTSLGIDQTVDLKNPTVSVYGTILELFNEDTLAFMNPLTAIYDISIDGDKICINGEDAMELTFQNFVDNINNIIPKRISVKMPDSMVCCAGLSFKLYEYAEFGEDCLDEIAKLKTAVFDAIKDITTKAQYDALHNSIKEVLDRHNYIPFSDMKRILDIA